MPTYCITVITGIAPTVRYMVHYRGQDPKPLHRAAIHYAVRLLGNGMAGLIMIMVDRVISHDTISDDGEVHEPGDMRPHCTYTNDKGWTNV